MQITQLHTIYCPKEYYYSFATKEKSVSFLDTVI